MLTRLFTVVVTLLAFLHTFALAAPLKKTYALPKPIYYPFNAVHFRSTYSSIPPDTKIELAWEGGSGNGYVRAPAAALAWLALTVGHRRFTISLNGLMKRTTT